MKKKDRKKPRRHKGPISLEDRLNIYWRQHKRNLYPEELISLALTIEGNQLTKELMKERVLREFLTRADLNFDLFDRMLNATKDIFGLKKNKNTKNEFLKQCFDICTENNLVELTEAGFPEAVAELFRRIETGSISRRRSLQVLIRFFKVTTSAEGRITIWKKIARLNPNEDDLKDILDLTYGKSAFYKVTSAIEKYIRKRAKRKAKKIIIRIKELIKEIERQKDKKQGQE
ncbi:MAG: hypothetical protein A2V72_00360 [Candidatus Nealsonbacteria bacterium RBG_13_37_56]|uniref:Uncharacterized protein n=1 Tax=Candidatus Nealsonbacteria bacterium RBG_13_37_56 TaxID=1801661 RepID=A0A1G2DVJ9_9BACT|nr:MAG: hypothetical protein A2V72_00360 [Candidatus Nealsonbacteria bacterium RBG_13_37_56]